MFLQRLSEYGLRLQQAEDASANLSPGYKTQSVRWLIQLEEDGSPSLVDVASELQKALPQLRRSGQVLRPQLLADSAEYVFGLPGVAEGKLERKATSRAAERHRGFVNLVQACSEAVPSDDLKKILAILQNPDQLARLRETRPIAFKDLVAFRCGTRFPTDDLEVQRFWARVYPKLGEKPQGVAKQRQKNRGTPSGDAPTEEPSKIPTVEVIRGWYSDAQAQVELSTPWGCIVCGNPCTPLRVHPAIKLPRSVSDKQCSLITVNKRSFASYGLTQSLIAPTCRPCAERYTRTLNHLIAERNTCLTIAKLAYIFWTRRGDDDWSPVNALATANSNEVRNLLASAPIGFRPATNLNADEFYAAALSASGARVVVRDWLETTVPEAKANLARWFRLQETCGEWGHPVDGPEAPYLPVVGDWNREGEKPKWKPGLLDDLAPLDEKKRRDLKKLPTRLTTTALRLALNGGSLPEEFLQRAVLRNQAEQGVTRGRAALIRLALLWHLNPYPEKDPMTQPDAELEPAYLCGRLLAVLEAVQRSAVPNTKATLTDRFYGAASTMPATAFPSLMKLLQAHMSKLRKNSGGAHERLQQQVEEIIASGLKVFPTLLSLEQQGRFSLGYYNQRANDRRATREAKEARAKADAEA